MKLVDNNDQHACSLHHAAAAAAAAVSHSIFVSHSFIILSTLMHTRTLSISLRPLLRLLIRLVRN